MNTVDKVEKVSKLFQPGTEWLYGYTKSYLRLPTITVDASDTGTAMQRTKHQGFLSGERNKQTCILLLAAEVTKGCCMEFSNLEEPVNCVPEGWMQLAQGQEIKTTLDIEIGGCRVTVDAKTDPELLKKVCRILRVL